MCQKIYHVCLQCIIYYVSRFINARRRILQPMLDASNPEQSKAKKPKHNSRPPQRFWPFTSTATSESESGYATTQEGGITTTAATTIQASPTIQPQTLIMNQSCELTLLHVIKKNVFLSLRIIVFSCSVG